MNFFRGRQIEADNNRTQTVLECKNLKSNSYSNTLGLSYTKNKILKDSYFTAILTKMSANLTYLDEKNIQRQISKEKNRNHNVQNDFQPQQMFSVNTQNHYLELDRKNEQICRQKNPASIFYHNPISSNSEVESWTSSRPSLKLFDVRSKPFQSPNIEEQFEI